VSPTTSRVRVILAVVLGLACLVVAFLGVRSATTPASAAAAAMAVPAPEFGPSPADHTVVEKSVSPTTATRTKTTSSPPPAHSTATVSPPVATHSKTTVSPPVATHPKTTSSAPPATHTTTTRSISPAAASAAPAAPAALAAPAAPAKSETVVLAGGCFWGVQGVFEHVKGVTRAESGYAGGSRETADYETVSTGTTGHAESVRVTYDPAQVTYGQILQVYFSVAHDPTELDRQGPDTGSQYRSEIFAQNGGQQRFAESYVAQLTKDAAYPDQIVTRIEVNTKFVPAEAHHQDFLNSNPTYPYIAFNDMPKVQALERMFPQLYREQPVLIFADDH